MPEVIKNPDCGNSPKNIFVQDLAIALSTGDTNFVENRIISQVQWTIPGQQNLQGITEITRYIANRAAKLTHVVIHQVVTHGKAGAVNGTRNFQDGQREDFCDVYEFTNAKGDKIQTITSYVIKGVE